MKLIPAQSYVLRELRILFEKTRDAELKPQINILEETFRKSPSQNVKKELNKIKSAGLAGDELYKVLLKLYEKYALDKAPATQTTAEVKPDIPVIVCSEALI